MTDEASTAVTFSPLLDWLVSRAGIDEDALKAARAVDAAAVADGASDPARLVDALKLGNQGGAACRLLACALPPREGVWWGWVSARQGARHAAELPDPAAEPAAVTAAFAATERWIAQPDEDNRRAAWTAADAAGMDTAAGCAAAAVFFTGGSVAPPNIAHVPPPPGMHCILAAAAVVIAATVDPPHFAALLDAYIGQGLGAVAHLGGWDDCVRLARQYFDAQSELHAAATGAAKPADQSTRGA